MAISWRTARNERSVRSSSMKESPSYQALLQLPVAERIKRMQDPAFRAQVLSEAPSAELLNRLTQFRQRITTSWNRMFPMADPPNYEPEEKDSIAAIAARSNHSPMRATCSGGNPPPASNRASATSSSSVVTCPWPPSALPRWDSSARRPRSGWRNGHGATR